MSRDLFYDMMGERGEPMQITKKMRAVVVASTLIVLASCGDSENPVLFGYTPPSPKSVAAAQISEVGSQTPFTFKANQGEVLVVYFGYTNCPDMCPTFLVALKNAKKNIGDLAQRVDLAMVTVDPARDTAEILPRYLSSFTDKFHALIPSSDEELVNVKELFQVTSSVTETNGKIEVVHSGTAYVVDNTGTVVVEWPFGLDTESMTNDLEILLTQQGTKQ
jgi:protein SCO1/2